MVLEVSGVFELINYPQKGDLLADRPSDLIADYTHSEHF
jgi:hypothetical protein